MKYRPVLNRFFLLLCGLSLLVMTACGGGGGDKADPASLTPVLCAGTITYQDSGEQNILFAAVKGGGSGISGWVENPDGKKIAELAYVSAANAHEATLSAANTPLTPGKYTLYYTAGTETFTVSKNLEWGAALPRFLTVPPPPTYDNRILSVGPVEINSGTASYYLRVYSAVSDYLYSESTAVPGGVLTEYLSGSNDQYRIMVIADVIENNQIVATARYRFAVATYN